MTTPLEETRPASFRGVNFSVKSSSLTAGRNVANYLYINSGRRISKDLGRYVPDIVLEAFVFASNNDGEVYENNKRRLQQVLDDGKKGILVDPFNGDFFVRAGKYTMRQSEDEIGVCRFTIPFFQCEKDSENPVTPTGRLVNPAQIKKESIAASRALQSASANAFIGTSPISKDLNKSAFESFSDSLKGAFSGIGDSVQQANEYTKKALDLSEQASFYANNPLIGFAAAADLVLGIDGLTLDTFAKFLKCKSLFNFSDTFTTPFRINENPATIDDAEKKTNNEISGTFIEASATIEAFAQAGNTEFETTQDIDSFESDLEEQFEYISNKLTAPQEDEIFDFNLPVPDYSDTYAALKTLRESTKIYFKEQRASAANIKTITVQPQPASILSYALYGDSSRGQEIMDLNGIYDNMSVSGTIQVLDR